MKKFLLCMMLAGLMMPVVAQEKLSSTKMNVLHISETCDLGNSNHGVLPESSRGILTAGGWRAAGISNAYDRQSQGSAYPMMQVHDNGFIGCTWTNEDNPALDGFANDIKFRGVGYSYSTDQGQTWSWSDPDNSGYQENRIGGIPLYWPSYAQWGPRGEIVLARSADTYMHGELKILNGLVLLTREIKGQGEWNINVVPYPEGYRPSDDEEVEGIPSVMAWARMTTSGPDHKYVHIMSPMNNTTDTTYFVYYYRTQDGGLTWDTQGELVTEMVGQDWGESPSYNDAISFAVRGDIVACSFIRFGNLNSYVLKSSDNGDTWKCINFYHSNVGYDGNTEESIDTVYIPSYGCVALDSKGKVHVAFGASEATNNEDEGYITYFSGLTTSFLSYWNEDMPPIDGNVTFLKEALEEMLFDNYFDWDLTEDLGSLYVISTVPQWPVIGYYTPTGDDNFFQIDTEILKSWMQKSYNMSGMFSFSQMAFDANDVLHLVYLGVLDDGKDGSERWKRHPFYTTTADNGTTWTQTNYPVNHVAIVDSEFAYLTLGGLYNNRMYLMAQTDPSAGVYTGYGTPPVVDHEKTKNSFTVFWLDKIITSIENIEQASLSMQLFPNPTSGQVTVKFAGKGDITIYNMLGQSVYRIENVENQKDIPLNMVSGVYFVTVRSGNATATQKLIVK